MEEDQRPIAREAIDQFPTARTDPYDAKQLLDDPTGSDLLDIAHGLREDADIIEKAHWKIEDGEWTVAEAAIHIATETEYGGYSTERDVIETHDLDPKSDQSASHD